MFERSHNKELALNYIYVDCVIFSEELKSHNKYNEIGKNR